MTYVLLGLLGISLGLEPNESIGDISRWCERVSGGIFREPSNALSNIGFMIVGLLMFRVLIKDEEKQLNLNQFQGLQEANSLSLMMHLQELNLHLL